MKKDEQTGQSRLLQLGFSAIAPGVDPGDSGERPSSLQSSCYLSKGIIPISQSNCPYSLRSSSVFAATPTQSYKAGVSKLSVKGQTVNLSGLAGHPLSNTTTQLSCCSIQTARGDS